MRHLFSLWLDPAFDGLPTRLYSCFQAQHVRKSKVYKDLPIGSQKERDNVALIDNHHPTTLTLFSK